MVTAAEPLRRCPTLVEGSRCTCSVGHAGRHRPADEMPDRPPVRVTTA